jgi:adenosylhomocysteine nucleosidase
VVDLGVVDSAPVSGRTTLGFLAPMPSELEPLQERLALTADGTGLDAAHHGRHRDHAVIALLTGVGMSRAGARASHLIDAFAVDHVIVVGVAGGIAPHLSIGDVVVPEAVTDRRDGRLLVPTALPTTTPAGRLLSGDDFIKDHAQLSAFRDDGAYAIDMETAAIGRVCEGAGVPWSVFRGISDDAFDPQVDDRILALMHPDGSPDLDAVTAFVAQDPRHADLLARLGRDLAAATSAAVDAALEATHSLW